MKKRIAALIMCFLLLAVLFPTAAFAAENTEDIVILFETDAHCVVEGYTKLSAMKKELQETYAHVGVVSGGDFVQGNSLGAVSEGSYIVELMNLVGYDAVTLGNHEFDYRMERLEELVGMMDTAPICCNFQKVGEDAPCYEPYSIVSYGDVDVAFIGIITPSTITTAAPTQFKDDSGSFLYTFHTDDLYEVIQKNIDAAKAEGADYIIALSHVGYADDAVYGDLEDVETLIRNTDGFDVVLDGHAHTVLESKEITDKGGNPVLLSSTGTKFEYIGKLTISGDSFRTELIKIEEYLPTDPVVDARLAQIYEEYSVLGERKVATTEVDLIVQDENETRLVRNTETNLGDLFSEAFRWALNADVGYLNGGGVRSSIPSGDITYNSLLNVLPFNNTLVLSEISGRDLRDMMEMAMMAWPNESGAFPHISGLTFSLNTSIESSVVISAEEEFVEVAGPYRVYDIKVFNREKNAYEPLDLDKTYTIAASNFYLLDYGSGMTMLKNTKVVQNEGMLDVEAVEGFITENLGGTVGEKYREASPNITFTEGEIRSAGGMTAVLWIAAAAAVLILVLLAVFAVMRARAKKGGKKA